MNVLEGVNPVAKVIALVVLTTPLMLSVDAVSAGIVLAATVLAAPLCGVGLLRLARRGAPIMVAAALASVSMALFGAPDGHVYLHLGLFHVTDNSLSLAVAIFVRVLAIGLPVVVLSAHIDATELGDGLAQILHLPHRFVIATVAGVRLIGLLRSDLASIRMARRARGLADDTGLKYWLTVSFGVLVSALRRSAKLATAMEARGFGRGTTRTWARPSRLRTRDVTLMVVASVIGFGSVAVAVAVGAARFLGVS
ncbi:energy-coupling factor transporter transmembrane component T family protein [Corynebacterium uterequi]|uniref:ABC-type cobalt transport system, permease component CbiQ n=1 Tax=Corynebacterium uterequi TaxID=1072256 RepID=A0A0G3HBP1_9CORY|nr:energy-coupling factor transporter transmembrane component T [Corynebacterium uterequi]AKK10811.1 ABC-type cobalt transport system, permease component CbiQ [Corynebacterium uterequi]